MQRTLPTPTVESDEEPDFEELECMRMETEISGYITKQEQFIGKEDVNYFLQKLDNLSYSIGIKAYIRKLEIIGLELKIHVLEQIREKEFKSISHRAAFFKIPEYMGYISKWKLLIENAKQELKLVQQDSSKALDTLFDACKKLRSYIDDIPSWKNYCASLIAASYTDGTPARYERKVIYIPSSRVPSLEQKHEKSNVSDEEDTSDKENKGPTLTLPPLSTFKRR